MSLVANPDQIILIDKPAGISSFGVVAVVRRYLTRLIGRRVKVGHCGTLDPFATGLLILVSGRNTRRAGEFSGLDKVYQATIRLGARSTTGDPEGEITESHSKPPSLERIREVLSQFTGQIQQVPPSYSAIKVHGKRAYQLARAGKPVALSPRTVQVYS
ncbi:tRNA pseudouridine(55) synthase TruB, partial [Candidatus Saccharibacteria bacterium]|nr:tRNA pseudouridine(55) synthase TruB [Candidatus Saccharibacteria bacterium]